MAARTSDPDRFDDIDAPWPTFVRACAARHWSDDDIISALSTGSWLGVPREVYDALFARVAESSSGLSCDEYRAIGATAYARTSWVLMRGLAYSIAATLAGDACSSMFTDSVATIATSSDEHPEARLAAIAWQVSQGDESGCRRVSSIMNWHSEDYNEGPGAWAEAQADRVRELCD